MHNKQVATIVVMLLFVASPHYASATTVEEELPLPGGACILQGTTSPESTIQFEVKLKHLKDDPAGQYVRVRDAKEVLDWCTARKQALLHEKKGAATCDGIVLGGHAGGGGVTDFLGCHCSGPKNKLTFLNDEQNGKKTLATIFACFQEILKPGAGISIASCAGAYPAGPHCAYYLAARFLMPVKTTNSFCTAGKCTYASCEKGWSVVNAWDKPPTVACPALRTLE
ncbi:MAG: hypothetical protein KDD51_16340, partial [Bdellovibrionales bacterium]|nr:hypothetical protein [Bdellovibrionales bacterium]